MSVCTDCASSNSWIENDGSVKEAFVARKALDTRMQSGAVSFWIVPRLVPVRGEIVVRTSAAQSASGWKPGQRYVAGRRTVSRAECFPECAKAYPNYESEVMKKGD
jgi:hypothetical protein